MPLNLSVGDADFTPYIKYNAKAGRFYAKPEGGTEFIEINNPVLAFDMAHIRTGWIFYAEGAGPEKVWDISPSQAAPKPAGPKKWKRGFEVLVVGNNVIPGTNQKLGLREFSSNAANVISAICRMYEEYEAGLVANSGKVPVYTCKRVKPVQGQYGENFEPMFELTGWIDRSRVPAFDEGADKPNEWPAKRNGKPDPGYQVSSGPEAKPVRQQAAPPHDDMDQEIPF